MLAGTFVPHQLFVPHLVSDRAAQLEADSPPLPWKMLLLPGVCVELFPAKRLN